MFCRGVHAGLSEPFPDAFARGVRKAGPLPARAESGSPSLPSGAACTCRAIWDIREQAGETFPRLTRPREAEPVCSLSGAPDGGCGPGSLPSVLPCPGQRRPAKIS